MNKLSQLGTGHNMTDVLKGLYTGKVTFKELWDGTYAKYPTNSVEYINGTYQTYNQAFRNVPYGMMLPYLKQGANGYPEVKDINGLITQLTLLETQTQDPQQKARIRSQIIFLQELQKSPNGKAILDQAFINMGITYKDMTDNKDGNADKLSDELNERSKKYQEFLDKK